MASFVPAYLLSLVFLAAIDFIWLGFVARNFYARQLGELLLPQPKLLAAGLFYLVYALGLAHFAVLPGLRGGGWTVALGQGAVLGFVAYATYDLSNLATLKGWPIPMTVVDLVWGTVLSAAVAAGACAVLGWLGRS
jgi:uncharacterized membrane protein